MGSGPDQHLAEDQGFRIEDVTDGAIMLRGRGPITTFDDTQLAAMEELLAPVLLPLGVTAQG